MYLKQITLTGFKSFATKTVLRFDRETSAIVGPNGSGKSNVADAIRWTLGEQNKGKLRTHDREGVIFAGSDNKARASYAEVILLFDNESGKFPIDASEVEISRRLYRSGEAEYRLCRQITTLKNVQTLMSEAGFGAGTYAVIGQGMIDSFLMSSPAERKIMFDEAAGIRAFELKRTEGLRQLDATVLNVTRLRDIAAELEPRLRTLQDAVDAHQAVERLDRDLTTARLKYIVSADRQIGADYIALTKRRDDIRLKQHRLRHVIRGAELSLSKHQSDVAVRERSMALTAKALAESEQVYDSLNKEYIALSVEVAGLKQAPARSGEFEQELKRLQKALAVTQADGVQLGAALKENLASSKQADATIARIGNDVSSAQSKLLNVREELSDGGDRKYLDHALQLIKTAAINLNEEHVEYHDVKLLVHKAGRLLSHASKTGDSQLIAELSSAQAAMELAMSKRETAISHQTNITIQRRSLEIDAHQLAAKQNGIRSEISVISNKIKSLSIDIDKFDKSNHKLSIFKATLHNADTKVQEARRKHSLSMGETISIAHLSEEVARLQRARTDQSELDNELIRLVDFEDVLQVRGKELTQSMITWDLPVDPTIETSDSAPVLLQAAKMIEVELVARRSRAGDVMAEYTEVKNRYDDMVAQIADLELADANLKHVVYELDQSIKLRFKKNFSALSNHFGRYFSKLFSGGTAALELSHGDDGEYGVDICVSPKGKRLGSLSALSGGERAMAGVALLAAILNVNPSPFVVLDEIDAALDEANSGRLSDILTELEVHSQLILITHNRQTMRAAKSLYGVTMDLNNVSKLISLRLDAAETMAAR